MRSFVVLIAAATVYLSISPSFSAQNACETRNLVGTDSAGKSVPIETYVSVPAPTLVSKVLYAVTDPQFIEGDPRFPAGRVTGSLSLSLVLDEAKCPIFPYPLGIVLKDARVSVSEPLVIEVAPGQGQANISFDKDRFVATLSEIIPLPPSFSYRAILTDTPEDANGFKFSIAVVGMEPIGEIFKFDLVLDIGRKDFGLAAAAEVIGALPADLAGGRQKAVEAISLHLRRRIQSSLTAKKFDFERVVASSPTIDWAKWDRGDQFFSVSLEWKGVGSEFRAILPATAELRLDGAGKLRLNFPPVDAEKLRVLLAAEVGARLTDPSLLDKIAQRFGDIPTKSIPGGWLRIRNLALTESGLSAEVAFAISDQVLNWQKLRIDFPAKKEAMASVVTAMAASANALIKKYLETFAKDAAYQAVVDFVNNNKTMSLFGQPFLVELVKPKGAELPPVPLIKLSSLTGDIAINNVGLTIQSGSPRLDWTNTEIKGAAVLAERLFKAAGLQQGDLGLTFANLQFASGRLTGTVQGNIWGSDFSAPFSIGEKDSKISLPSIHQQLVSALQRTLDNKMVSAFGLQLSEFKMCPDGPASGPCSNNGLGASAKFEVENIFTGVLSVRFYPSLAFDLVSIQALPGLSSLTDLFQTGAVTVDLPPSSINPLVVSGTINLAKLWDAIPIPPIPYKWSAKTRKITLSFPTVIPIDTDIFIPPGLNLSQIRIPISAAPDGSLTVGIRITVGEHYVQYIFNIDGTVRANPKDTTVSVLGSVSLISIPLYEVDGKVDFPKTHIHVKSQTKGLLKAILPQEGLLDISGKDCLAWQRDTVQFLFFKFKSDLLFQVPAAACNRPLSKRASDCGIPSGGGLCLKANASAGVLGDMDAQLLADLSLRFKVAANTSLSILGQDVKLGLEGSEKSLLAKAKVLGMKFGFSIANPDRGSDRVVKDLLEAIVRQLLKPNIKIPSNISASSGDGKTTVSVEVSKDEGETPAAPASAANAAAPAAQPPSVSNEDKQANQGPAPPEKGPGTTKTDVPKDAATVIPAQGQDSEITPFETGSLRVRFDEQNYIVQVDKDTGASRKSTLPIHKSSISVLKSKCKAYAWFTMEAGSGRVLPADGDGVILATSDGCPAPPKCSAGQLCVLALRSEKPDAIEAVTVTANLKWRDLNDIIAGKMKAGAIENAIILESARAAINYGSREVPLGGEWICLERGGDNNCVLTVEMGALNDGRAFGSERAGLLALRPGSFLYWAAEQNDDAFKRSLFKAADNEELAVYGRSSDGWLVDGGSAAHAKGLGVLVRQSRKFVPIVLTGDTPPATLTGFSTSFENEAPLEAAIDTIAKADQAVNLDWRMRRLATEEGRRMVLSSTGSIYLFAEAAAVDKQMLKRTRTISELGDGPNGCFDTTIKDPGAKLAKIDELLSLTSRQWRARGLKVNPVALIFEQACKR